MISFDLEVARRETRRLTSLYMRASKEIKDELSRPDILDSSLKVIDAIERKVKNQVSKLDASSRSWTRDALANAYRASARRVVPQLIVLRKRPRRRVDHEIAIATRAKRASDYLEIANISIFSTTKKYLDLVRIARLKTRKLEAFDYSMIEEDVEDIVERVLRIGESPGFAKREIEELLDKFIDEEGLIEIGGRQIDAGAYAEMLARTELREAQSEAVVNYCKEYENDLVMFSNHASPCAECASREGQIYSISGSHPNYPPLTADDTPPIHPNCEHNLDPTSDEAIEFERVWGAA